MDGRWWVCGMRTKGFLPTCRKEVFRRPRCSRRMSCIVPTCLARRTWRRAYAVGQWSVRAFLIGVAGSAHLAKLAAHTHREHHERWLVPSRRLCGPFHCRAAQVWNATVANLTLMALGSSAPEILLNVIDIFAREFFLEGLGPSTIVGSAAFNLLMIIAVCIVAIPDGQATTVAAWRGRHRGMWVKFFSRLVPCRALVCVSVGSRARGGIVLGLLVASSMSCPSAGLPRAACSFSWLPHFGMPRSRLVRGTP